MRRADFSTCPLCRGPLSTGTEISPPTPPPEPAGLRYVVLMLPTNLRRWVGTHSLSWAQLEARLTFMPGTLAGRLAEHGVQLRVVNSVAEARRWWTSYGLAGEPPHHP